LIIIQFSYLITSFDKIMLIRRVFVRNKKVWQKKYRSAPQSEILIVKVDHIV